MRSPIRGKLSKKVVRKIIVTRSTIIHICLFLGKYLATGDASTPSDAVNHKGRHKTDKYSFQDAFWMGIGRNIYWSVYLRNFDVVESKKVWTMQAKLSPKDVYHHLPSIDGIIPI